MPWLQSCPHSHLSMPEAVIDDVPVDHLSNPPRRPLNDQTDGAAHHDSNRREMLVSTGHHVSDPFLLALLRGVTAGEVSATDAIAHALDYVDHHRSPTTTPAETDRRVAFSGGASGAEGGAVVDSNARELLLRVADGRMTADEALPFVIALVDDGNNVSDSGSPSDPGYTAIPLVSNRSATRCRRGPHHQRGSNPSRAQRLSGRPNASGSSHPARPRRQPRLQGSGALGPRPRRHPRHAL